MNALDPICLVARSIGHLGASVTNSVFSSVATAFGNTADSAINWLWSQMTSATAISFGGPAFALDLGVVSAIAAVVCVGLFLVQLAASALKRDGTGIGRAVRGLVVATVGCAITLASLDLLLAAVDQLCSGVVSLATGDSISTLGAKIIDPAMFTGLVAGPGAILILSLIAIVAVAVVWFALVVRKMLIIITAIFAPLAFAGGVADLSRGWVRKWLEAMLALVFSKLILILIFIIGLGVLGGMGSPQNAVGLSRITGDITGLLILLVAGLSPWMALKLVHFTGEHMATLATSASHATSGASRVISAPQKVASMRSTTQSLGPTPHRAYSTAGVRPDSAAMAGAATAATAVAGREATAGAAAAAVGGAMHTATSSTESPASSSFNGSAERALRHLTQVPANSSDEFGTAHATQRRAHESRTRPATSSATSPAKGSTTGSSRPPAQADTSRADATMASAASVGSSSSRPRGGETRAMPTSPQTTNGDLLTRGDRPSSDVLAPSSSTSRTPSSSSPQPANAESPSPPRPTTSTSLGEAPVPTPTSKNQPARRPTSFPSAVSSPVASPVSPPSSPLRLNPPTRDEETS